MITKAQAENLKYRNILHHVSVKGKDGLPARCRVNGKLQTWKTRPDEWKLPVKYGLKECFYITHENADKWEIAE